MFYLFLLCIIQALTEFLPVSSTAHMIVFGHFIDVGGQSFLLHVGLHLGSFLAVLLFYAKDVFLMVTNFIRGGLYIDRRNNEYFKLALYLLCATVPAIIIGYFLKPYMTGIHSNLGLIATCSILFGGLLSFVDINNGDDEEKLTLKGALFMGFAQLLAFFPGGSRLGTTITAARMMNISRQQSFRFSMLLSLPVVFGAVILSILDASKQNCAIFTHTFILTTGITFILSLFVLTIVHNFINRIGFAIFGFYRILFGIILLLMMGLGGII